MKTVWVIEDNPDFIMLLEKRLRGASFAPKFLRDGWEVISSLGNQAAEPPAAVVLDLMLPGRSGHELLNSIQTMLPDAKIFVFSSHKESFSSIPKSCVEGFFLKTDGVNPLVEALERVLVGV